MPYTLLTCLFSKHPCESGKHHYHHVTHRKLKNRDQREGPWVVNTLCTPTLQLWGPKLPFGAPRVPLLVSAQLLMESNCRLKISCISKPIPQHTNTQYCLANYWQKTVKRVKTYHQCLGLVNGETLTPPAAEYTRTPQKMLALMEMRV